jgi:hypothetical protein
MIRGRLEWKSEMERADGEVGPETNEFGSIDSFVERGTDESRLTQDRVEGDRPSTPGNHEIAIEPRRVASRRG